MPRIVFATALPVGLESVTETVNMELEGPITPLEVMEKLNPMLPQGIEIFEAEEAPPSFPLDSLLHRSVYWISLNHLFLKEEAITKIKKVLDKETFFIHQKRKGKRRSLDVRPLIERMEVRENRKRLEEARFWGVELVLRNEGRRMAKPSEIVEAILGLEREALAQCRIIKIE
jgi:radical SAM-linked protein